MKPGLTPQLAALERSLRDRRIPFTFQRRLVFETLAGQSDHPTADELYEKIHKESPSVSRTTVYRVLEMLVDVGAVVKVNHPGVAVRYDALTSRHHHLVCTLCDQVFDWTDPKLDRVHIPERNRLNFKISDYSIYFNGTCLRCQASPQKKPNQRKEKKHENQHRNH